MHFLDRVEVGGCEKSCRITEKSVKSIFLQLLSVFKEFAIFVFINCGGTWLRPGVNLQGPLRSPDVNP